MKSILRHKKIVLFVLFCSWLIPAQTQQFKNANEAFSYSLQKHKALFLIFSGSDWCQPCMRFNKTILSDSSFIRFALEKLVILTADFPQRKKLPEEEVARNEELASRYNPKGDFPRLVLLNPDQSLIGIVEYNNQSPGVFIEQISNYLHNANMLKEYSIQSKLMGSAFEFIVLAENKTAGDHWLNESIRETKRIESLLTEFDESSQTSFINRNAGIRTVTIDKEVYELIERSNRISRLCDGAFDISAGVLKKLYNFRGENFTLPDHNKIKEALSKTGYQKIELSPPDKVYLSTIGMRIGFGAIGKGYAADQVKKLLQKNGVSSGVINASGDLTAWGNRANGEPWKTGIAHPDNPSEIIVWLPVNELSVATSGNYIQYFDVNGVRYSHNIDPKTGYPVTGIKSVSIISPCAELSDALATAVTVMGVNNGLHFINQLPQTHAIIVDEKNNIYSSQHLNISSHA